MIVLGLTGPIASGKSFIESCLTEACIPVIDVDKIVHELYCRDAETCQEIAALFDTDILTETGFIERSLLRAAIQRTPEKLADVEKIIHPKAYYVVSNRLQTLEGEGFSLTVLSVPLMPRSNMRTLCDAIITCMCPETERRNRALQRAGITQDILDIIISKQPDNDCYKSISDYIINTHISKEHSRNEILRIVKSL